MSFSSQGELAADLRAPAAHRKDCRIRATLAASTHKAAAQITSSEISQNIMILFITAASGYGAWIAGKSHACSQGYGYAA
jgi:hypothetical protein